MRKKITYLVIIALLLRVFISAVTYHSDVIPFDFAGRVIAKGNILNFYNYLWDLPNNHPDLKVYPRDLFNFPPIVYFFLGGVSRLTVWMVRPDVYHDILYNFSSTLGNLNLNLYLLLLKLPYFFFDFGVAYLLYKYFDKTRNKLLALCVWLFNPVSLYAVYMIASFDIIPTFFTVLVLYLVKKRPSSSLVKEGLLLGLGGAFKIFPLMFLFPLALIKTKWIDRIKIIVAGVGVYLVTILPFIGSTGFRRTALLAGQTTKSLYAAIPISGGEAIVLFPVLILFLYLSFLFKEQAKNKRVNLWKRFFLLLLVFFTLTHYHPQWFLWLTPFLLIDFIYSHRKHYPLLVISLISYFGLVFFFDPGLSVWLFTPLFPGLYGLPSVWQLLGIKIDYTVARSLLQSLFVSASAYYFYLHFDKKDEKI